MEWVRSIIEVLKFTSAEDVLLSGCLVCSLWTSAAANSELCSLYIEQHPTWLTYRLPNESLSSLYQRLANHSLLYSLSHRQIQSFDCLSSQFLPPIPLDISIPCDTRSAIAVSTDSACIYWCGGGINPHPRTYKYENSLITRLGNMQDPRNIHSLVYFDKKLYVFGGNSGNRLLSSAEIMKEGWKSLGNMRFKRAGFNACVLKDFIYLIGGYTDRCEAFSMVFLTYSTLNFSLPQNNSQSCVAITASNVLIIATKGYLTTLNLNNGEEERREMKETQQMHLWSCSAPVVKAGKLYRVNEEGVKVLDLCTLDVERAAF